MTTLILSLFVGLLGVFGLQSGSYAEVLQLSSVASAAPQQSQIQPAAYESTNTTVVGIVPASAFPSCQNVVGGILFVTRTSQSSATVNDSDPGSEGPTCGTSATNSTGADTREPLFIVPMTREGTLSQQPCMTIATPQRYCEIPSGSSLSAFPLV